MALGRSRQAAKRVSYGRGSSHLRATALPQIRTYRSSPSHNPDEVDIMITDFEFQPRRVVIVGQGYVWRP
ncbi:hypothetical protein RB196_26940 [Streptomyces sp. PmtA]|uniref:hypothetical protein n=1 Tax=Streptomyces sp. PmtA TaxID=3074275 RepID=UPI0030152041